MTYQEFHNLFVRKFGELDTRWDRGEITSQEEFLVEYEAINQWYDDNYAQMVTE
jgi:hypothetical protein